MDIFLGKISHDIKQKIYECIFQALCEDRQEADAYMGLKTHVSGPFLNWRSEEHTSELQSLFTISYAVS